MKPDALGVKALDPHTLEIDLERPTPYMLGLLAHQTAVPVNPANVEKFGKDFVRPATSSATAPTASPNSPRTTASCSRATRSFRRREREDRREEILPLEDRSAALATVSGRRDR